MNENPEREVIDSNTVPEEQKAAETVLLPAAVEMKPDEIDEALEETGLTAINIKRFKALEKIGADLQKQGALRVGIGELIHSNQIRMEMIQNCRRRLRFSKDVAEFSAYAHVLNTALSGKDQATKELLKTAQSGELEDSHLRLPHGAAPKGQRIVAVQINNTVSPPEKKQ